MLPYRVYQPQELRAISPLTPLTSADLRPSVEHRTDEGPGAGGGLRPLLAALTRLVRGVRLRRPAPGTI